MLLSAGGDMQREGTKGLAQLGPAAKQDHSQHLQSSSAAWFAWDLLGLKCFNKMARIL